MPGIEELLQIMVQRGGSDLHVTAGAPPKIRIDGQLISSEHEILGAEGAKKIVYSVLTAEQIAKFEKNLELDFSFGIEGLGRFRTNVFQQRGAVGGVFRIIPYTIQNFHELGLPREHILDPWSRDSSALRMRVAELDSLLLWSVGKDGIDDDGEEIGRRGLDQDIPFRVYLPGTTERVSEW